MIIFVEIKPWNDLHKCESVVEKTDKQADW